MKQNTIINSSVLSLLSELGHTDTIAIADCGLPIPRETKRCDLALTFGVPAFLTQVLELLGPIPVRYVSHEELKRMTAGTKGVIRTGECTPLRQRDPGCGQSVLNLRPFFTKGHFQTVINPRTVKMRNFPREDLPAFCIASGFENPEKVRNFIKILHFKLQRNLLPTVPLYADGSKLLVSGALLPSVSAPKKRAF